MIIIHQFHRYNPCAARTVYIYGFKHVLVKKSPNLIKQFLVDAYYVIQYWRCLFFHKFKYLSSFEVEN